MSKALSKASEIIELIEGGVQIDNVKLRTASNEDEWFRFTSKAYNLQLEKQKDKVKALETQKHVLYTSNEQILQILELNEVLADYALLLPATSTVSDLNTISGLAEKLPLSENEIVKSVGKLIMHPKLRAMQKKGRYEQLDYFKQFFLLVDAAVLSYYRANFISCYFTLVPIIEGILIRQLKFEENLTKPDFEKLRKFFKNPHIRQPIPSNILFHNIYCKACDAILNKHFYKPTTAGTAHKNFNRHSASHLLTDSTFATQENCIRLFLLLDTMTEIFLYETRKADPRFSLGVEEMKHEIDAFGNALTDNLKITPENIILKSHIYDFL